MEFEDHVVTEEDVEAPAPKEEKAETVTLTKAELDSLKRDRDEARQSERAWANLARQSPRAAGEQPAAAAEVEEKLDPAQFVDAGAKDGIADDTAEKLVDELASSGIAALKKRGFITAADAQKMVVEVSTKVARELVGRERQKITSDNTIVSEFPGLKAGPDGEPVDRELFDETAKHYRAAVAMDPRLATSPAALYQAAQTARAILKGRAKPTPDRQPDREDRYPRYESERDRQLRASSQDGRQRGRQEAVDDDLIGEEARSIIKQIKISEEDFKKQKQLLGGYRGSRRA